MSRLGIAPADLRGDAGAPLRAPCRCGWRGSAPTSRRPIWPTPAPPRRRWPSSTQGLERAAQLGFRGLVNHAANSAAAVRFPAARLDAVRPGLALYGAMPSEIVALPGLEGALALAHARHGGARRRGRDRRQLRRDLARGAPVAGGDAAGRLRRRLPAPRPRRRGAARADGASRSSARSAWTC